MKKLNILLSGILLGCISDGQAYNTPFGNSVANPRLIITGLAGENALARGDFLVPFAQSSDALFFGDFQGEYGDQSAWYAGAGLGYRKIIDPTKILGAYVFVDNNQSEHHNDYPVVSPGVELLSNNWDVRLNGYIPVSAKTKSGNPFFLTHANNCGINEGTEFIEFRGHQQFEHQFINLEQVGPGIDGEVGITLPGAYNLQIHAGGYFFDLKDFDDVRGVEARVGLPITPVVTLTAETSYDNQQRGRVVAGLQFTFGGPRCVHPCSIASHLEDPIMRNLGTVGRGNGIPIISRRKDNGLVLTKDNIFFFSPTGTGAFSGATSGTFENPLAANQFSQITVDDVFLTTGDGSFYFASGTYTIQGPGAPNAVVTLHDTQGIFGRSADFRSSAVGAERPILLGGLIFEGNNTLDSIQLINALVGTTGGRVVALDLEDAPNNHICNSNIVASAIVNGDLIAAANIAVGIHANNSELDIMTSTVSATSTVNGTNIGGLNAATGIGEIGGMAGPAGDGQFIGNAIFQLIGGDGTDGIGGPGDDGASFTFSVTAPGGASGISTEISSTFSNNTISLFDVDVQGVSNVTEGMSGFALNSAVGIGTIAGIAGIAGNGADGSSVLAVSFSQGGDGGLGSGTGGVGGNGGNATLELLGGSGGGQGGNAFVSSNFTDNVFDITDSNILGTATIGGITSGLSANLAAGIGAIGGQGGVGGTGGDGGDLVIGQALGGDGGDGLQGGQGGNGGFASSTFVGGAGGNGGNAFTLATFTNNNFDIDNTFISGSANGFRFTGFSVNAAMGIGGISGIGGPGGAGGLGGAYQAQVVGGNGGDASEIEADPTSGGNGGTATLTGQGGDGGNGGSADALATFASNQFNLGHSAVTSTGSVTENVINSANIAVTIGSAAGEGGVGGNGNDGSGINSLVIGGNGGNATTTSGNSTGGNGGVAFIFAESGAGGSGGSADSVSTFSLNSFEISTTPLTSAVTVGGNLTNSANLAVGLGSAAGIGGIGGNGANAGNGTSSVTSGDGGDGFGGPGGVGGDAIATLNLGSGGSGGSGNTFGIFNNNSVALTVSSISASSQAQTVTAPTLFSINSAVTIGTLGGFGGQGGNGGANSGVLELTTVGTAGAGPDGGAPGVAINNLIAGLGGSGGDAQVEGRFNNNNLTLTTVRLAASSDITNNLNLFSENVSITFGGIGGANGTDGLTPIGGSGQSSAIVNNNTATWVGVTALSNATVENNVANFSFNESISVGADLTFTSTNSFENNIVNIYSSNFSSTALIEGNNNATGTNKALGLFAGNGTVINFLNSTLNVNAIVLGVNAGTNTTVPTATAGTGVINF